MINIAVTGASGRMGRTIIKALAGHGDGLSLSAAIHKKGSESIGLDAGVLAGVGCLDVFVTDQLGEQNFDMLIDFSTITATLENLNYCCLHNKPIIIGTTGFNQQQTSLIEQASKVVPIVFAPNMSIGVNLCFHLLHQAASVMGEHADIEILETHHRHKIDAPSGTALHMGRVIADALSWDFDKAAVLSRQGSDCAREEKSIGFASVRAGDVVGDHTALFAVDGERVEITHKSSSRQTYAQGALRAAKWLHGRSNGLFDMQDVLNLRN